MIHCRCWYCDKSYMMAEARAGERVDCKCGRAFRVPKTSGTAGRVRGAADWAVEILVYGGGGAALGCGLGLVIVTQIFGRLGVRLGLGWELVAVTTVAGLLAGTFGGERGVNWLGRLIRAREDR